MTHQGITCLIAPRQRVGGWCLPILRSWYLAGWFGKDGIRGLVAIKSILTFGTILWLTAVEPWSHDRQVLNKARKKRRRLKAEKGNKVEIIEVMIMGEALPKQRKLYRA